MISPFACANGGRVDGVVALAAIHDVALAVHPALYDIIAGAAFIGPEAVSGASSRMFIPREADS
jgi:hypothetical protein